MNYIQVGAIADRPTATAFNERMWWVANDDPDNLALSLSFGSAWIDVASGGGGGGSVSVTDGVTTVNPATEVDFTAGAAVTDLGGGIAGVSITAPAAALTRILTGLATPSWSAALHEQYAAGASTDSPPASFAASETSIPTLVGVGDPAATPSDPEVLAIPVDVDNFDLSLTLYVTDLTGTNLIVVTLFALTTPGDTSLTAAWTDAVPSVVAGTDLSWDGANVISAAGGVFVASLAVATNWD